MSHEQHQSDGASIVPRCAIITLSDTRTLETDKSGQAIRQHLEVINCVIADYRLIKDEPDALRALLDEFTKRDDIDVILTNGGTGISPRDQTATVLEKCLDTTLPGFGELFRMLSFEQIGSGAMLSRAIAGVMRGKLVFAMPGSTKAVTLALNRLILPELKHLLAQLRK